MSKHVLPNYNINSLKDVPVQPEDFVADHFAHYLAEHKNLYFPHKHAFYQLVYFSKGSGNHAIDFVNFRVEAGQIYFMIPGQVHSWDFKTKPDGYIANFSEQYINALVANPGYTDQFSFFSGIANHRVITLPQQGRNKVELLLETAVREGNSKESLKDDFAGAALIQLFILVSRSASIEKSGAKRNYNKDERRMFFLQTAIQY